MPRFDFACQSEPCGRVFEHYLPLARYKECPPCPDCGTDTVRAFLPSGAVSAADPVVVFRAPDGTYRFPGDAAGVSANQYRELGYDRVELRGWAEVRAFETKVNRQEFSGMCQRMERLAQAREEGERRRSEAFRHGMAQGFAIPELDGRGRATGRTKLVHLSPMGRRLMELAHQRNSNRPSLRTNDPGFHVEAYSMNRGSREESRDAQGRRRRD